MKKISLMACAFLICSLLTAQQYISTPVQGFSYKKIAYITLNDGTEIEGQLKGAKRKKGLFERITLKDAEGEKTKIPAADIKSMYLPQSSLGKIATGLDKVDDIKSYDSEYSDINMEHMKDGYAYFEATNAQIRKKKEGVVLMQLLNPSSSSKIKIYFDPYAQETMSVGVGGMKLAGGDAKSYFVKVGEEKAIRLKKKEYKDMFADLYSDCPEFKDSVKKVNWTDFGEHVFNYTNSCKE